jgi:hypothetical protein
MTKRVVQSALLLALLPAAAPASLSSASTIIEPTCADLMAALKVADPGERPTKRRKEAALQAQDDIATALFWLHGWNVAKGQASLPVTRDWMVAELKRVTEVCRAGSPDGSALVSEVATR